MPTFYSADEMGGSRPLVQQSAKQLPTSNLLPIAPRPCPDTTRSADSRSQSANKQFTRPPAPQHSVKQLQRHPAFQLLAKQLGRPPPPNLPNPPFLCPPHLYHHEALYIPHPAATEGGWVTIEASFCDSSGSLARVSPCSRVISRFDILFALGYGIRNAMESYELYEKTRPRKYFSAYGTESSAQEVKTRW